MLTAAAELALGDELSFHVETELSRNHQQISGPHKTDIIRDWCRRRGQGDAEIGKLFFNFSGHVILPHRNAPFTFIADHGRARKRAIA